MGYRSFHEHGNKKTNIRAIQKGVFQSKNDKKWREKDAHKDTRHSL